MVLGLSESEYTYDGTDAGRRTERRGLVTNVETRVGGDPWYTSTAAQNQGGALGQRHAGLTREDIARCA